MSEEVSQAQPQLSQTQILLLAIAAYLSFLCILPIFLNKKNSFIIHHAKQGLTLFSIEVATVLLSIIPFFGMFVSPVILSLCLFFSVWGILGAVKNQYSRIILLSDIAGQIHL
ncbi:MAG: hypothetical protein PHU91_02975 [Candidatus Omnitrophica bacterium]|nr:hypothetical protein [Candidatus Omnitrophota bacterium]MDD5236604.1 hypothetical protein [Candidatus Omnitrophota bacterium]MDD5610439.1 hypothetical protein [Candidatus Omnitrophota bacterium]